MKPARLAALFALPLLLASCLYSPGKFTSAMTVKADGHFTFAYQGEIVFLSLYQMMNDKSAADNEKCSGPLPDAAASADDATMDTAADAAANAVDDPQSGDPQSGPEYGVADRTETSAVIEPVDPSAAFDDGERACTAEEIAARDAEKAEKASRGKEEAEQMQQMLGFNPEDEASMQAFAAQFAKQKGWKSVVYRGKGVFDVDYELAGSLDRDFVFPVFPDSAIVYPMVIARKRADGSVQITAPAFANNGGNPMAAMAMTGALAGSRQSDPAKFSPADGSFTLLTDAPIATNNTEDGPVSEGAMQKLVWPVTTRTTKVPEALLRLRQ